MNNDHEPVLAVLFARLQAAVTIAFTGDADGTTAVLRNIGSIAGLYVGLPVVGPGVPRGSTIAALSSAPNTVTLSQVPAGAVTAGAFTAGCLTTSRRLKFWTEVADQPAMFMRHTAAEDEMSGHIGLGRTTIEGEIWLYSKAGQDPNVAPDIALNQLVKATRTAFAADNILQNTCTLGALAYWARIEGRSEYDPGDIDDQSKAVIPFKILLP